MKKPKSIPQLVKSLDTIFSLYRRADAADSQGMVQCFTSGKTYFWKEIQLGHFISRRHYAIRWEIKNTAPQSVSENVFNQGNAPVFGKRLQEKYGEGVIDELLLKKNNKFHLERFILETLIREYKEKYEAIKKEKSL